MTINIVFRLGLGCLVLAPSMAFADPDGSSITVEGAARITARANSSFPTDRHGTAAPAEPELDARVPLRATVSSGDMLGNLQISARIGGDAVAGTVYGKPTLAGDDVPGGHGAKAHLFEAYGEARWGRTAGLKVGLVRSHWGMGLVANDGSDLLSGRPPGWFVQSIGGDRVLRAFLHAMPLPGWIVAGSVDRVVEDDSASLAAGEEANQGVVATRFHLAEDEWFGLYFVRRDQQHDDGKFLEAQVVDAALDLRFGPTGNQLRTQAEVAFVSGRTSLSPSTDHPEHDLAKLGAAGRISYDLGTPGLKLMLDTLYASGDQSMDDERLTGFRADKSYQFGLLLHRRVLGWQTARARLNASDPMVTGRPAEDLDRFATDGAAFSTMAIFPKVGWRFSSHAEVYGGALLAWTPGALLDPFNSRASGGGLARNFLDEQPSDRYLGTELDVGVHLGTAIPGVDGFEAAFILEYGLLLPGAAIGSGDTGLGTIHGGRFTLALVPASEAH